MKQNKLLIFIISVLLAGALLTAGCGKDPAVTAEGTLPFTPLPNGETAKDPVGQSTQAGPEAESTVPVSAASTVPATSPSAEPTTAEPKYNTFLDRSSNQC